MKQREEKNYHCIFFGGTYHESMATVQYDKQYGFHEEMTDCTGITHWLEERELPSEEQINNVAINYLAKSTFLQGAKYLLDKILK